MLQVRSAANRGTLPPLHSDIYLPQQLPSSALCIHLLKALAYAAALPPLVGGTGALMNEPAQTGSTSVERVPAETVRAALSRCGIEKPLLYLALAATDQMFDLDNAAKKSHDEADEVSSVTDVTVLRSGNGLVQRAFRDAIALQVRDLWYTLSIITHCSSAAANRTRDSQSTVFAGWAFVI